MRWAHKVSDLPKEPYKAILVPRSISIPGDERSRTNPGHGYPASTEQTWDIIVFPNEEAWISYIKDHHADRHQAVTVTPAKLTTEVKVDGL